jgi:pimeloyl-ACP methyl ester carboxylesterase
VVSALAAAACASTGADDELHFTSAGAGRTIVFVHGWTCDLSVWSDQVAAFAKDHRVIALDLPGHGQSPAPADGVYTMDLFAAAVESVRADSGAEDIVLVGHSMGVAVIGQYALRYPQHVAGLVAVDGRLPLPAVGEPEAVPLPAVGEPWREAMIEAMFVPETPADVRRRVRAMMLRGSDAQALGIAMAMRDPLPWDDGPVVAPMLAVVAGNRPGSDPSLYAKFVPRLEMRQLPGTGHFLMMEQPARFNALLRGFLEEIAF